MHPYSTDILEQRRAERITWAGMAVNFVLLVAKITGGIHGRSRALLADGFHSISDFISDVLVLVGLHFIRLEKDQDHPYGHGKIETLATMGIALLLAITAFGIGFHSIDVIVKGDISVPHRYTILIAAASIALKEGLYWITSSTGRRMGSDAMIANALHHRSDAWTSGATLVGVSLSIYVPALRIFDPLAALFVSLFILKAALDILKKTVKKIIDASPPGDLMNQIRNYVIDTEGVKSCHDLTGRYYADKISMEIHIEVEPEITVREAHEISDAVSEKIKNEFDEVKTVLVHIDPYDYKRKGRSEKD